MEKYKTHIPVKDFTDFLDLFVKVNSTLDFDDVVKNILDKTAQILAADATSVLLLDHSGEKLYFYAATGQSEQEIKRFTMDADEGIVGWVVQNAKPALVPDVEKDSRFFRKISQSLKFKTSSILCVPMVFQDHVVGAIELVNQQSGKPFSDDDLFILEKIAGVAVIAVENARRHGALSRENICLKTQLQAHCDLIGRSAGMEQVNALIDKVAPTPTTVLIRGESGTGKEVVARTIHEKSTRRDKPLVCVTCALYSEHLLESELFGHEKGAFTGATEAKRGRFELADGGTLFLDEIGTVNPATQVKLLRFLQEREFERVGGSKVIKSDVRIIAATNEDLEKAIAEGRFRQDLYYRLKVIQIDLPPLKDRKGDVRLLAEYFTKTLCAQLGRKIDSISAAALDYLCAYSWPGNIRELRNVIERAVVLCASNTITPEDLPLEITSVGSVAAALGDSGEQQGVPGGGFVSLEESQKAYVSKVLEHTDGNKSQAAKILGISRNRLERKLQD